MSLALSLNKTKELKRKLMLAHMEMYLNITRLSRLKTQIIPFFYLTKITTVKEICVKLFNIICLFGETEQHITGAFLSVYLPGFRFWLYLATTSYHD